MRHFICFSEGVSCACGVAMRENNTILIADMCHNDSARNEDPKYLTNDRNLPDDATITVSPSAHTFKVNDITALTLMTVKFQQ